MLMVEGKAARNDAHSPRILLGRISNVRFELATECQNLPHQVSRPLGSGLDFMQVFMAASGLQAGLRQVGDRWRSGCC